MRERHISKHKTVEHGDKNNDNTRKVKGKY